MSPIRRPLRIPRSLAVATLTLVGTAACSPSPGADVVDVLAADIADQITPPVDAPPDAPLDAPFDAATDAPADIAMDDVPCDVFPGGPGYECLPDFRADVLSTTCPSSRTCTATACPTGCVSCYGGPFALAGFMCLPDPHADATVTCPTQRVCAASDCPTGCQACNESAFCSPMPSVDGSVVTTCNPREVCNPADCPPGCEALV